MTIKEQIAVMQAYLDGKKIQFKCKGDNKWFYNPNPIWEWASYDYRIKPEPKYRPYKDTAEMVDDFKKRFVKTDVPKHCMPLIWVKSKRSGEVFLLSNFSENMSGLTGLDVYFRDCTYLDGTPIGKLVEE